MSIAGLMFREQAWMFFVELFRQWFCHKRCDRILSMRKHAYRSILVILFLVSAAVTQAQGTTVKSFDYGSTTGILNTYCSSCHTWAATYEDIMNLGYVISGDPDTSPALQAIDSGQMPPTGVALTEQEKQSLFNWILAGAPRPIADPVSLENGYIGDEDED